MIARRRSITASLGVIAASGALAWASVHVAGCSNDDGKATTNGDASNDAGIGDASDPIADGGTNDDASDAASAHDATCPLAQPSANATCDDEGLFCEYGDGGPHATCTTVAHCDVLAKSGGMLAWHVQSPDPNDPGCGVQPSDCPTAYGEPLDAACPSTLSTCDYAEGRCGCVICDDYDGSPEQSQWKCRAWSDVPAAYADGGDPAPPGLCATDRPRLGTRCTDETIVCGYDSCSSIAIGPYMWCAYGNWAIGPQTDSCNHPACR